MAEFKGHPATPKRLEKARRDGQRLKSPLITQLFCLVSLICSAHLTSRSTWVKNRMLLQYCWSDGYREPAVCAVGLGQQLFAIVVFSLIFGSLVSIIAESLQVGIRFNVTLIAPRISRLHVGNGLKRIAQGLKGSWQLALRLWLFSLVLFWFSPDIVRLGVSVWNIESEWRLWYIARSLASLLMVTASVASICAVIDYTARRHEYFRELSMSTTEIRQEHRDDEGDPQIRAQRQALFRSMSYAEIVKRARESKVIIVERAEQRE